MIEHVKVPGSRQFEGKVNAAIDSANTHNTLCGDDQYIFVMKGPGYEKISLNMQAILSRIPKTGGARRILVYLVKDGGIDATTDGYTLTPASYTYTLIDYATGTVLATNVPLLFARYDPTSMYPAEWGIAEADAGVSVEASGGGVTLPDGRLPGFVPGSGSGTSGQAPTPWRLLVCDESPAVELDCVVVTDSGSGS